MESKFNNNVDRHSVILIGYNDSLQAFLILNSWGSDWAYHGMAWIKYDVVRSNMDFCWPEKMKISMPQATASNGEYKTIMGKSSYYFTEGSGFRDFVNCSLPVLHYKKSYVKNGAERPYDHLLHPSIDTGNADVFWLKDRQRIQYGNIRIVLANYSSEEKCALLSIKDMNDAELATVYLPLGCTKSVYVDAGGNHFNSAFRISFTDIAPAGNILNIIDRKAAYFTIKQLKTNEK